MDDDARTTIGTDWGEGPSLVEGVPATIQLPAPPAKVKAWPLDEKGQRTEAYFHPRTLAPVPYGAKNHKG